MSNEAKIDYIMRNALVALLQENADADAEQGTLVLGQPNFWVTEVICLNPEFDLDFGLPALPRENEEKVKFPDWIISFKCKNHRQG
ncbi:hypothetical protein N7481_009937 [Penicillium waksmanii]|uniref:uncharacterized protein n=1 Tax=Penicillium waksmanii TaxID=69791 RepID=UPI002546D5DC|nr:uncharacterized protein N7481_009937 [Penicillium waksmanii]KAJ5976230.1 hypothetical protein N7481_009937 [Penicillium waksmanii]